jgi:predicted TIM-barrel fold metal-dependent hydrolase
MVVDFHTHCFPDYLARRAISKLAAGIDVEPQTDGTVSGLRRSMKDAGISISVVQPVATRPQQVRGINVWAVAEQAKQTSNDQKLLFFGSLHPDLADWQEEIRRIKEDGLHGVKFHPDYQDFFVDEERMWPIYEALFRDGLIILFHAGVDIGLSPPVHCTPEGLSKVLQQFPGGRIVAAHMGGYQCWDGVERHLAGKDVFFDTSYSFADLGASGMTRLIRAHGSDKVLFGTDSPWTSQKGSVASIQNLDLPAGDKERILYGNAFSLLGF